MYDECPHRGIPLSVGRQEFPGTWTCRYHGWTFDLADGVLKAALTDGPNSPICGKVRVKMYPVEERAGLVFVWMGEGPPVAVEQDISGELLEPDAVVVGRVTLRQGNWRYACENAYDDAHAKYLHRYGALMTMFSRLPGWSETQGGGVVQGDWLTRPNSPIRLEGDFPGLGRWPRHRFWNRPGRGPSVAIRLPGSLQVRYRDYTHYTWYVPVDQGHHRYYQLLTTRARGLKRALFRLRYWLYRRWIFHVQFNDQDAWMVELMPETAPERLFRPDASITAWRRLCEHARGEAAADGSLEQQLLEIAQGVPNGEANGSSGSPSG
jgi:phenylpropionate dioxygenase-like ring-hydroxylating dioxygenase large terminal subunit